MKSESKQEQNYELWKTIKTDTNYEISSLGRIRNKKTGRILAPQRHHCGYLIISLNGYTRTIHRLVAEYFVPNMLGLTEVDHINGDKTDNRACNLRYSWRKEQLHNKRMSGKCKYIQCEETEEIFHSAKEVASKFGFDANYIRAALRGDVETAYGKHWKRYER